MANYMALLDGSDNVLLDLSGFVGGLAGNQNPRFPTPERMATRSETFTRPRGGQYIGSIHDTIRVVEVPIFVSAGIAGVGSTSQDVEEAWTLIAVTVSYAAGLKVQFDGVATSVIYDLLRDPEGRGTSVAEREVNSLAERQLCAFGVLRLEAQPYTRAGAIGAFTAVESS